jgi:mRNA-degrading endonuclease RelE of RelBE toxin-antitoxin system
MSWACDLTDDAKRELRDLPKPIQERVARALDQMQTNPFQGDVRALQGDEWKGVFGRRLGDYRVLFLPDSEQLIVRVLRIAIRSRKTYRQTPQATPPTPKRATVTAFVTVGFSHARYPTGNLTWSIWMGPASTIELSKAKSL